MHIAMEMKSKKASETGNACKKPMFNGDFPAR